MGHVNLCGKTAGLAARKDRPTHIKERVTCKNSQMKKDCGSLGLQNKLEY